MTLLFIENRHKTYFFDAIVQELQSDQLDVHWLIQNKQFLPTQGSHHIIEYPKGHLNGVQRQEHVEEVIKSDRQLNHFNQKDTSYFYYYDAQIEKLLLTIKPDIVFGESTAFHELLTIANCKKHDILYLNPSTCRYPVGRFSFYKYDTLEPYRGSQEVLSNPDAETIIDQIVNRKTVPDYMKPVPTTKATQIKDQVKKTFAYVTGEKYNTPNPLTKIKLEKLRKSNILKWDENALDEMALKSNAFKILYPLQMQPEANIDVWGRKHRDQTALIKDISDTLPQNSVLVVKPNPKSKYELTEDLFDLINSTDNIVALKHNTKMDSVLQQIDLVVTVTGTVAIECVLNNKPVITLINTINNTAKNCVYLDSVQKELKHVVDEVKNGTFKSLSNQEKIDFINNLNKTSYKGVISDPFSDGNCVGEDNLEALTKAFETILY